MNVGSVELSANKDITQKVTICPRDYKQTAFLADMEGEMEGKKTLVFAERKATVDYIERMLRNRRVGR
jgi:superfamily II DNA/RNA helicase